MYSDQRRIFFVEFKEQLNAESKITKSKAIEDIEAYDFITEFYENGRKAIEEAQQKKAPKSDLDLMDGMNFSLTGENPEIANIVNEVSANASTSAEYTTTDTPKELTFLYKSLETLVNMEGHSRHNFEKFFPNFVEKRKRTDTVTAPENSAPLSMDNAELDANIMSLFGKKPSANETQKLAQQLEETQEDMLKPADDEEVEAESNVEETKTTEEEEEQDAEVEKTPKKKSKKSKKEKESGTDKKKRKKKSKKESEDEAEEEQPKKKQKKGSKKSEKKKSRKETASDSENES